MEFVLQRYLKTKSNLYFETHNTVGSASNEQSHIASIKSGYLKIF